MIDTITRRELLLLGLSALATLVPDRILPQVSADELPALDAFLNESILAHYCNDKQTYLTPKPQTRETFLSDNDFELYQDFQYRRLNHAIDILNKSYDDEGYLQIDSDRIPQNLDGKAMQGFVNERSRLKKERGIRSLRITKEQYENAFYSEMNDYATNSKDLPGESKMAATGLAAMVKEFEGDAITESDWAYLRVREEQALGRTHGYQKAKVKGGVRFMNTDRSVKDNLVSLIEYQQRLESQRAH